MFYKFGENKDKVDIVFFGPWRMAIDQARNQAVKMALAYECDFLFFYDDDMFFADPMIGIKLLNRLIENEKVNLIQALAFIRGYPYKPMVFHIVDLGEKKAMMPYSTPEELDAIADETGLVRCDAVGCCCTMMRVGIFNIIPEPWFLTGQKNTEDIFFCAKMNHYLEDSGIYCDLSVEAGHLLDKPVLTRSSRKMLIEIHEKYNMDQVWLPDATFVERQSVNKKAFDLEVRPNPFDQMDKLNFKEKKNESNK